MGMEENYVVHGATIQCPYALRHSNIVVPINHGVILKGGEQLTVADSAPMVNILSFGACTSPKNPAVQQAAAEVMDSARKSLEDKEKGFFDKVAELFCKPKKDAVPDESLVAQCAAPCVPAITGHWDNGKETVEVDGKAPLLGGGTIACMWSEDEIIIIDTGQPE